MNNTVEICWCHYYNNTNVLPRTLSGHKKQRFFWHFAQAGQKCKVQREETLSPSKNLHDVFMPRQTSPSSCSTILRISPNFLCHGRNDLSQQQLLFLNTDYKKLVVSSKNKVHSVFCLSFPCCSKNNVSSFMQLLLQSK